MSDKPRSLKKNFGMAFVGNAVYQACQAGMLVALTKLLDKEEVGRFALALAISSPIVVFIGLNLRPILVTDIKNKNAFGDFVTLRIFTVMIALSVLGVIAGVSGYPAETVLIIMIVGLNHCMLITREVLQSYMQKFERLDYVAVSQMAAGLLSLTALGVTVYLTGELVYGVLAVFFARVLSFITWDRHAVTKIYRGVRGPDDGPLIRLNFSRTVLIALAWLAFPTALMSVMTRFVVVMPQYFIEGMIGRAELGVFAALAAIPLFGQIAVRAAGSSALPRLSRIFADHRPGFFKLVVKLAAVGLVIGAVGVLIALIGGKPLITLMYTADYAQYQELFVWLMVYGAVSYCAACIGYALHATRWFWIQPAMFVLILVVVASFCWLWIPEHGLIGAAMAMIVGRLVQIPVAIGIIMWACARRPQPETVAN